MPILEAETATTALGHAVVSPEAWLAARRQLLAEEKELTRRRDDLARRRRELPWQRVEKSYAFDGPNGRQTLADLFGGRGQLIVYHFMFGPEWREGCPSCSMVADHLDASFTHLAAKDVALVAVSRARRDEIEPFQKRMGWRFPWVSSYGSDFNRDYQVSFTPEERAAGPVYYNYGLQPVPADEVHGASVFARDGEGNVFHTYSAYARGVEEWLGVYGVLDLLPKGREEEGLPFPMAWIRHHDRYEPAAAPVTAAPPVAAACCATEAAA